jgi:hypothetical protein
MKSNTLRNQLLALEFNATPIASIADNAVASPLTNLHVALHTAFPGYGGSQTTNEVVYTGYSRKAVQRSSAGFTVAGNIVTLTANVLFDERTDAGSAEISFFSVGRLATGAGTINRIGVFGSRMGLATATAADVLTVPGHTLAINDRITVLGLSGISLPAGVTEGALYFVKTVAGNDITLSVTAGGATLDITTAGSGVLFKSTPITVTQGVAAVIKSTTEIRED